MDKKQLFKKTLEDLKIKSQSNDWYDMLLISGLIYKLLYDEQPLVNEVKNKNLKISFKINNRVIPSDPSLIFWSIEDGFDPETSVSHLTNIIEIDKEELYRRPVMIVKGEIITVKDLIKFLRNKQGGVHNDTVKLTDKDKILKDLQENFFIGGVNLGLRLMRAISRVIIKGLEQI